jgi:hypothetical protein
MPSDRATVDAPLAQDFISQGYAVARGLFSPDETATLRDYMMELREQGEHPGDWAGVELTANDPLKRYPRLFMMHRWDERSLHWLLDARIRDHLTALLGGTEPYAVQTMCYFKPPGARGQALHQDQYYLRVKPGTCVAAWLALDSSDEENGCMQIVPGTHDLPILCTVPADTRESFTDVTVPIPDGYAPAPIEMEPGDVLFFNGQVIHGSFPNRSATRFRRALIGHYIVGEAEQVAKYYHPILRFNGSTVDLGRSGYGGPCGMWVDEDGEPVVAMKEPEQALNADDVGTEGDYGRRTGSTAD